MNFQLPRLGRRPKRTIAALQEQSESARQYFAGHACGVARQRKLSAVDLQPTTCQWIEGEPKDRMFCGEPNQDGSSYCPHHHAICYVPAPRRDPSEKTPDEIRKYIDYIGRLNARYTDPLANMSARPIKIRKIR